MKLHILEAGPLTTVQDNGRFGYMEYGITTSGVMDHKAYELANTLTGNANGEAVLEMTLMGCKILFEGTGRIGVAGADMDGKLDDETVVCGQSYDVCDGQILSFGMAKQGVRTYLAVSGGIDVPLVMGSRSTNLKCKIGGFQGRKLMAGDTIETKEVSRQEVPIRKRQLHQEIYEDTCTVRVILGPQDDYFTKEDLQTFFTTEYVVSPQSDRMGIRLKGASLKGIDGMDIVSDGITFGSIQITSEGLPIILMADHQTTGGYAKIATVVSGDLWKLAQARLGTIVRFEQESLKRVQRTKPRGFSWIKNRLGRG